MSLYNIHHSQFFPFCFFFLSFYLLLDMVGQLFHKPRRALAVGASFAPYVNINFPIYQIPDWTRPDEMITREQMAVMIVQAVQANASRAEAVTVINNALAARHG